MCANVLRKGYCGYQEEFLSGDGTGAKGERGEGITVRVKLPLFLGGFYPFLGCPALFLRPSTVEVKTNRAGRENESEGEGGGI